MRHITNNVNILLLIIIVLMASSIVAYNHYQDNMTRELAEENKQMKQELTEMKLDLATKEERLRETFSELQRQLQDSVQFESLYTDLSTQRETLNASLSEMTVKWQDELTRRRSEENRAQNLSTQLNTLKIEKQVCDSNLAYYFERYNQCVAESNS
jgi:septal ring factor EnvC (AmiA/AmiB activator)